MDRYNNGHEWRKVNSSWFLSTLVSSVYPIDFWRMCHMFLGRSNEDRTPTQSTDPGIIGYFHMSECKRSMHYTVMWKCVHFKNSGKHRFC